MNGSNATSWPFQYQGMERKSSEASTPSSGASSEAARVAISERRCRPAAESDAMSKELKRRDFTFVSSTICYAFMQAVGMVNDHALTCFRYSQIR